MSDGRQPTRRELQDEAVRAQREAVWMTHLTNARQEMIRNQAAREVTLRQQLTSALGENQQLREKLQMTQEETQQLRLEREKDREEHRKEIEELRGERDELRMGHQSEQNAARLDVSAGPARQRDQEAFQAEVIPQAAARETAVEGTQQPSRPTCPVRARSGPRKKPSRRRR